MLTLAQWILRLTKGYFKATGKQPDGLAKLKIRLEAAEKVREQEKVIQFPKDRITDWWKPRPGDTTPIKKETTLEDLLKGKSHIDERGRKWTFKNPSDFFLTKSILEKKFETFLENFQKIKTF